MSVIRQSWSRFVAVFRKQQLDEEFNEEALSHIALATEDYLQQGVPLADAQRLARIRFGSLDAKKEEHRDTRGLPWLESLFYDLRFALRGMGRWPGFTAVVLTILAIGLGINTAVFTIANGILFSGYPHIDPGNRLLYLISVKGKNLQPAGLSWPDVEDWNAQAKSFNGIGAVESSGLRLLLHDDSGDSEVCNGTRLSDNSFRVLGQKPIRGRDFTPADGAAGAAPVAILNYAFWEGQFHKDPNIIGKSLHLTSRPGDQFGDQLVTVIGVMPPGFYFPQHWVDLWFPITPTAALQQRDRRSLDFAYGRLVKGATRKSAEAEMGIIGQRLESAYPVTNQDILPRLRNFTEAFAGPNATELYSALWGSVGFLLLIACANLANLFLGRANGRSREISLRLALGAGRWRIIRQFLIESLMFGIPGGLLGWLIASVGVRVYEQVAYPSGYQPFDFIFDSRVFFYLAAISTLSALLFGLAPAIRLSKLDVCSTIKDGGRTTGGVTGKRFSALLITVEIAVTVVLLAGAGLMGRSFLNAYTEDTGVKSADVLTASVGLPATRYPDTDSQIVFFDRLEARLKGIPGIATVALADALPGLYARRHAFELDGEPAGDGGSRLASFAMVISPGYFQAVGAGVLSGRDFNDFDRASTLPVVLVSERFAGEHWPKGSPLGKRLRLVDDKTPSAWRTVVGVTSNILQGAPGTGQFSASVVYVPYRQKPAATMDVVALTRVPPTSLTEAVRHEIQAMDSDLVIGSGLGSMAGPASLSQSLASQRYWSRAVNAGLYLMFAAIALLLAATGLYAVIANSVARTTQEIGVRIAIGATSRNIRSLVLRQGMLPVGIGLGLGLALSLGFNRFLQSQVVAVSPSDSSTYLVTSMVLISVALLASLIPANRAIRVDPAVALRQE